ncbi:MAG: MarP family serine protease [Actinomycetota bacterium]|nr:MarP family serine protease [Actinomycetota bacterium]
MNVVDLALLLALVLAASRGFRRGALSQVAAFGGAVVGLFAGAALAPRLASGFVAEPGPTLSVLTLGLLLLAVVVGQGAGLVIGLRLRSVVHGTGAAAVDRTAGIAVGVVGLLLTVWLLGSVLAQGPTRAIARQIRGSQIVTAVTSTMPPPPDLIGRVGGYLDQQGFPQVFSALGGSTAPPVDRPSQAAVAAAQAAGASSAVQVLGLGCGGVSSGSGFVTRAGFVVTNAHVVAGSEDLRVRSLGGELPATAVHVDSDMDLAVLAVAGLDAPAIDWVAQPVGRGTEGATLGFPGGRRQLVAEPAAVRGSGQAVGRDIYGRGVVNRDVLTLRAAVQRGDSGGPFVTRNGRVGGVVFAAAAAEPGTGYALTAAQVRGDVADAIARSEPDSTGVCRY